MANMVGNVLVDVWEIEDVLNVDSSVSDDDAVKVLELIARTHDATIGINWEVIQCGIDYVRNSKPIIIPVEVTHE